MVLELAKPPSLTAVARDCLVMSSASQDGPEARTALSTDQRLRAKVFGSRDEHERPPSPLIAQDIVHVSSLLARAHGIKPEGARSFSSIWHCYWCVCASHQSARAASRHRRTRAAWVGNCHQEATGHRSTALPPTRADASALTPPHRHRCPTDQLQSSQHQLCTNLHFPSLSLTTAPQPPSLPL